MTSVWPFLSGRISVQSVSTAERLVLLSVAPKSPRTQDSNNLIIFEHSESGKFVPHNATECAVGVRRRVLNPGRCWGTIQMSFNDEGGHWMRRTMFESPALKFSFGVQIFYELPASSNNLLTNISNRLQCNQCELSPVNNYCRKLAPFLGLRDYLMVDIALRRYFPRVCEAAALCIPTE